MVIIRESSRKMRVTAETKLATRRKILTAARAQFRSQGFGETTTRGISQHAGIAAGTLFNYFSSKEAIVGCLAQEVLTKARKQFERQADEHASLEESLFAHVATELRKLRPLRRFLAPALDAVFPLPADSAADDCGQAIRAAHLQTVCRLFEQYGLPAAATQPSLQIYWTLYTGVLRYWVADRSPKQEDSLALLDRSLDMFVTWVVQSSKVR